MMIVSVNQTLALPADVTSHLAVADHGVRDLGRRRRR